MAALISTKLMFSCSCCQMAANLVAMIDIVSPRKKALGTIYPGRKNAKYIFFHPDYTVGIGVAPIQRNALADFTAGRELHPALKIYELDDRIPCL